MLGGVKINLQEVAISIYIIQRPQPRLDFGSSGPEGCHCGSCER